MGIRILHLSDIHLGSGQNYGRLNPETGLNTRVEDVHRTLQVCMDQALHLPVDVVVFTGDAFPDATPAPLLQELFAQQFLRLVQAGIPVVLLVGNHDQHTRGEGGASLSIYRALRVPGVIVGESLATHTLHTRHGALQIVTLPWITRSTLLTKPETQGLSMSQINDLLLQRLRAALEGEILNLDARIPAILAAHVMVDQATFGAERLLSAGKTLTVPLSLLAQPCFRYVAGNPAFGSRGHGLGAPRLYPDSPDNHGCCVVALVHDPRGDSLGRTGVGMATDSAGQTGGWVGINT